MSGPVPAPSVDLARVGLAIRSAVRAAEPEFRRMARTITRAGQYLARALHAASNDPVTVAGLEARYFVTAGMDPAYAPRQHDDDAAPLHSLVASILAGTEPDTAWLTRRNRATVAAAAIRGWCSSYGPGDGFIETAAWECPTCRGHGHVYLITCVTCDGEGVAPGPHVRTYGQTTVVIVDGSTR